MFSSCASCCFVTVWSGASSAGGAWTRSHEPWFAYDPALIAGWAAELARQGPADDLRAYKFRHGDGREWIAFRVGTWLVDGIVQRTGQSAADLVWTPAEELEELCDLPQHRWRGDVQG